MKYTNKFYEEKIGKPMREVALDMWMLGDVVQDHHGKWTWADMIIEHPNLEYLLDHASLLNEIVFINDSGFMYCIRGMKWHDLNMSEKRLGQSPDASSIWAGGHKDARWRWVRNWMSVFGGSADAVTMRKYNDLLQEWRDFYAPPELPVVARSMDTAWMEEIDTQVIAHRWAVAKVMSHWMFQSQMISLGNGSTYSWMRHVWADQVRMMQSELEYRTAAQPKERSSKKKTVAAKRDFRRANEALVAGVGQFFSDDFVEMVGDTAFPFNVAHLNYEQLPEYAPENKPIKWMSDRELVNDFMGFITEDFDADSFEYEDRKLLMDNLRKQFARIKGQNVETKS